MVADGVGGQTAGEVASESACRRLIGLTSNMTLDVEHLTAAILRVHSDIYEMMRTNEEYVGMGTTIAGLIFSADACFCFNVGDSRVFRVQSGYLAQLSIDDMPKVARAGCITQCLGGTSNFVDILPHAAPEKLVASRGYLICSDGLTDVLSIEEIEALLTDGLVNTVEALFTEAMKRGANDNVSIVYARYLKDLPAE